MSEQLLLCSENLVKIYGKRRVVNNVSIEIRQGETVGLLGPNGAGKTTTFYMIVGMIRPRSGKIFLGDQDITRLPMYKRARKGISYLAQDASVFRNLSVEENLLAILQTLPMTAKQRKEKALHLQTLPMTAKQRKEKALQLMSDLNVEHLARNRASTLSGGERRRVEICRALATDPKFILLDEPFAGVDPIAVEDIQRIVSGLRERNIGVLITDHNVHETLSITDRAYLLFEGNILKAGTAEFLANDAKARQLYLGDSFRLDR